MSTEKCEAMNEKSDLSRYLWLVSEQIERRIARSKYLTYFLSNIFDRSIVYSGSRSEGVSIAQSDTDFMFEAKGVFVNDMPNLGKSSDQVTQLVMDLTDVHPGYTKLLFENDRNDKDNSEFAVYGNGLHSLCPQGSNFVSNTLVLDYWNSQSASILPDQHREKDLYFHGPCVLTAYTIMMTRHEIDVAISFKSKWPVVAEEWIRRERKYNWPSSSMINQIKEQGINLVPVGHANSPNKELEWRLSFSKAERLLVWSFNPVQQICMNVMKHFFNSQITPKFPKLFPSYFIKIAMFWIIEKTENCFWIEENLLSCLTTLFERLVAYLEEKKIDNYFIPADNMMDAKPEDKLNSLKLELLKYKYNCNSVWLQILNIGISTFDKNDIYYHHIQINCLSISRFFIYTELLDLDYQTCLRNLEGAITILNGTDIFPVMRRHLISEINITKACLQFYNDCNKSKVHAERDIKCIEKKLQTGCALNNSTGKLTLCTFLSYTKQYQEALTLLQDIEDQFTDLVVHYRIWERSKKPMDEDYDLSKPRSSFEDTMRTYIALDVVVIPFLLRIYPQSVQSIPTAEEQVLFIHPVLYTKVLKFHCHHMLQNHDECQNIFEEMKKCSALEQDVSDSTSENIISNCEMMLTEIQTQRQT
ncbi:uncharacterized protein LOC132728748 [Ruditapes philippinarum]|uniref:uncharacterized protein LOC132728748 n=1 Tax=Ruditapes philippinarum TaxID=129788 RepID=UPI00295B099E|nr:uncharacterized protein LOC132728748 [Ruditapes philippinarum]